MEIPLYKIFSDESDVEAVSKIIRRKNWWSNGPEISELEKCIAAYLERKYVVVFNSGTSALHAALLSLKIPRNSEIIVPSFTFISTAACPIYIGSRPVFCDIDPETYALNAESLKMVISKKTRAAIPIHYGGQAFPANYIREIADDENIFFVEDTAESLGAMVNNKKAGSFGDVAILSFAGNKLVTSGEGGAVVTDSESIYRRLNLISSLGNITSSSENESVIGYNWRMSTITAALCLSQFQKLDKIIEMRRRNANNMSKNLSRVSGVQIPKNLKNLTNVFQMYTIQIAWGESIRNGLSKFLQQRGITTKIYFQPANEHDFFKKVSPNANDIFPNTVNTSKKVLTLPMYPDLSTEEIEYIVNNIKEYLEKNDSGGK
jgi:perosamine synthetase